MAKVKRIKGTQRIDALQGTNARDIISGLGGNDFLFGKGGNDTLNGGDGVDQLLGGGGNDTLSGGDGSDFLDGGNGVDNLAGGIGNDTMLGGNGDDFIDGGLGNDTVNGGVGNDNVNGSDGNDTVLGDKGDDVMTGGNGNDSLEWNNGDGSDIISGNAGNDTVVVNGADGGADSSVLGKDATNKAFFERIALGGTPGAGRFTLTVDTSETFEVSSLGGNDIFKVNDLVGTGVNVVIFSGGDGDDNFDGSATGTALRVSGDAGNDTLVGGTSNDAITGGDGNDVITGGDGVDILTGGTGADQFAYVGNVFAGGSLTLNAGGTGINALNKPDVIKDFDISSDRFNLDASDLTISAINFQKGASAALTNGNVLVLTDGFAAAAGAAKAIAANGNITAKEGAFTYFNTTLGISRLVYSKDLANGGDISVLANLGDAGTGALANQANFTANNFSLV
jgi:Ca2+-binding RTX toxin-like protein